MNDKKQLEIVNLKLNVPNEYYPEWYRKGCIPFEVEEERLQEEARRLIEEGKMKIPISTTRQKFPAIPIENEEDIPKIRLAQRMQDPKETEWFDEMDVSIKDKIIDNNDFVFPDKPETIMRPNIDDSIENIRKKLLSKKKIGNTERLAEPEEYVILLKNKVQHIGKLEEVRSVCENIILENEDLEDNDIIVFYRVPISKIIE